MTGSDYRARFWRAFLPALALFWCIGIGLTVHMLSAHSRAKSWEREVAAHLEHRAHPKHEANQAISASV